MLHFGFVLALLAALVPLAALPLAHPKPAPVYAAMILRGKA